MRKTDGLTFNDLSIIIPIPRQDENRFEFGLRGCKSSAATQIPLANLSLPIAIDRISDK